MDDQQNEASENRREYSRVSAYIPFEVRLVPPELRPDVRSRIYSETVLTDIKILPDVQDQILSSWLTMLNAKLDTIIRLLTVHKEGFDCMPFKYVTISGSGMSFTSLEPFALGDILEIKMMLSMSQSVALYVYGEVRQVDSHQNIHYISVQFTETDDAIRDEIIRFVFEKEREILREKRRQ
ncbi:MAG: PilZ domain-containing protein [Deltaproteobacteria bacterium]|nr:PilZ domain-containing protein [Deltaproteobacteria bacterium]